MKTTKIPTQTLQKTINHLTTINNLLKQIPQEDTIMKEIQQEYLNLQTELETYVKETK